jgi:hypothetical protein
MSIACVSLYFEEQRVKLEELKNHMQEVIKKNNIIASGTKVTKSKIEISVGSMVIIGYPEGRFQVVKRYIEDKNIFDELYGAGKNLEVILKNIFRR